MITTYFRASAKLAMLILLAAATIFITKQDVVASYSQFASCEQDFASTFTQCENTAQSQLQTCNNGCTGPNAAACRSDCHDQFVPSNNTCFNYWSGNQNQCMNIYVEPARRSQKSCDREGDNIYAACIHDGGDEDECDAERTNDEINCTYP